MADRIEEVLLSVRWPDGGIDGMPTRRVAGMLAAALREAGIGDVAEAERQGAVRALREAARFSTPVDVVFRDLADVRDWLRDRADRLAEDAGTER